MATSDDQTRTPAEREDPLRQEPDEYEASGDQPWSNVGAEDPERVASGDRAAGSVEDAGPVPSGESEEDLAAEDLGAEPGEPDDVDLEDDVQI